MKLLKKIAVANRGEIAVRIIKTLKEMNIISILLHSSEDQNSLAYRLADETLCIGSAESQNSYLNISNIIEGAKSAGATALHPGVGFLSEISDLAQACQESSMTFIGPNVKHIQLFGNKIQALKHVQSLNIPTLPCFYTNQKKDILLQQAIQIGFPLLIKSACGGGGIGIKKVNQKEDFFETLKSVQQISQSVFGSSDIYLEKFLEEGRHIEVQIFGDSIGQIHHLFERDCSIQKRNQKIIEEAPSALNSDMRQQILQSAIEIGKSVQYKNAGTVEFLIKDNEFYFMEMNTRLQVEHPVTEMLLGVDLVRAQILTAMGYPPFVDSHFTPKGHAMECRIYSQDLLGNPISGEFGQIKWMTLPHSRFDVGYESYDRLPSFYDSLIGKVIVWAETRTRAIEKMKCIFENSLIFGLPTNIEELMSILNDPEFLENQFNLNFLNKKITIPPPVLSEKEKLLIQKYSDLLKNQNTSTFNPWFHNW